MFDFFKRKKADVLIHWYALIPGFKTSTQEFYQSVEHDLKTREVPGLDITREEFLEGGLLSAKREYLRMTRERLVFDICAAPFGTSYFFSCRFAELPSVTKWWHLLVLFLGFTTVYGLLWNWFGFWTASFLTLALTAAFIYTLRNAVAIGLQDLDAWLIKSPVIGPLYERFFRKETYYRQDTRLMYCDTVNEVVKMKVEEVTGAQGIQLVRFNEHSPVLGELYKPTMVQTPKVAHAA